MFFTKEGAESEKVKKSLLSGKMTPEKAKDILKSVQEGKMKLTPSVVKKLEGLIK